MIIHYDNNQLSLRKIKRYFNQNACSVGITVFLNSHLLSEIELTCDRVAFIREGEIIKVATLAELQQQRLRLVVRLGQPDKDLLSDLNQFGMDVDIDDGNGKIQLTMEHENQIPELINWLVSQGQTIYEISPQRLSLEDQFLKIIGTEMYDA